MSNKVLILPQLDELEKYHKRQRDVHITNYLIQFHGGWLDAIEQFRLMLEGIDVTVDLEVNDEIKQSNVSERTKESQENCKTDYNTKWMPF